MLLWAALWRHLRFKRNVTQGAGGRILAIGRYEGVELRHLYAAVQLLEFLEGFLRRGDRAHACEDCDNSTQSESG